MEYIICNINKTNSFQQIYIKTNETKTLAAVAAYNLAGKTIAELSANNEIGLIHLYGDTAECQVIIDDILLQNKIMFNNRCVEIEVN